jgi:LacI family transcriptional regulator
MAKPVTIRDVARNAGVALGTVSRVLNRMPGVDAGLSERVQQAARMLKYRPLRKRRAEEASGGNPRHGSIGVVLLGMDETLTHLPVVASALQGVEAHAAGTGVSVMLAEVPTLDRIPPFLARCQVDGLILKVAGQGTLPPVERTPLLAALMKLPRVWILGRPSGWSGDHCGPDDEAVGRLAAEHLVARGHRRLGWLNPKGGHLLFVQRKGAFVRHARELGARVTIFEGSDARRWAWPLKPVAAPGDVEPLLAKWKCLSGRARPTALFVPADSIAVQVYAVAGAMGVRVGKDVSVLSCNGEQALLAGLQPRLSTIDVRAAAIGQRAAELLLRRIDRPFDCDDADVRIAPRLIEGESVATITTRGA